MSAAASMVRRGRVSRRRVVALGLIVAVLAGCGGAATAPGSETRATAPHVPSASELSTLLAADPAAAPGPAVALLQRAATELPALATGQDAVSTAEKAAVAAARVALAAGASATAQAAPGRQRRLDASPDLFGRSGLQVAISLLNETRTASEAAPTGNLPKPVDVPGAKDGAQSHITLDSHLDADGTRTVDLDAHQTLSDGSSTLSSDSKIKVSGNPCPDAAGQVRVRLDASDGFSGSAGASTASGARQLSGTATAQVNDAADMVQLDFDFDLNASGQHVGGATYAVGAKVRFGFSGAGLGTAPGGDFAVTAPSINPTGRSASSTDADVARESQAAFNQFGGLAYGTLRKLQERWQSGGCVHIEAANPSPVPVRSSAVIAVAVKHRVDGPELHVPVSVNLSGGRSATPARIDASPGAVTYVAPDQTGASGTLTLRTVSRRGIDTLTLAMRAYAPIYRITGSGDGLVVDDSAGPLDQVFSFSGTFPGGEVEFTCTPANDRSGSVTGALSGSGVTGHVSGSYSIVGPDEGPLTMTQTTYGCVDGVPNSCRTVTSVFTLR